MIQLNEENYQEEVKNSKIPVFVDHYADWCGPCKMLGPIYEKLEKSFKGKATLTKLNVDDNPTISQHNNVRGIPAILLFKGGHEVDRITGYLPEEELHKKMVEILEKKR